MDNIGGKKDEGMNPESIIENIFSNESDVRYVAIMKDGKLTSKERTGLPSASSSESDKYEEILVNPTLLTLTKQRGNIDCGGLKFVIVGYGNFSQWVYPTIYGHVSVAIDPKADVIKTIGRIQSLINII